MTKMQNWTPEEKARLAAKIKAALEMPLPEPEFIPITESAPPGTKGRAVTVHTPDGRSHGPWSVKTGTCAMWGKWINKYGQERWSPVSKMFKDVNRLMSSNWQEQWEKDAHRDIVEFRIAKVN